MWSRLLPTAVAALALLAAPAYATKAELSPDGRFLDVTESSPGEANEIVASLHRDSTAGSTSTCTSTAVTAGTCARATSSRARPAAPIPS